MAQARRQLYPDFLALLRLERIQSPDAISALTACGQPSAQRLAISMAVPDIWPMLRRNAGGYWFGL